MSLELVESIKNQLEADGVDLNGPCGAFQITKRVAWALRHEGYGLLGGKNPAQNGCATNGDKYAVDWILKADGHGVDILADAGGANGPVWIEEEAPAEFYRPAFDPGDEPTPIPEPDPDPIPEPTPTPPPVDLGPILEKLAQLEAFSNGLSEKLSELTQRHEALWQFVHQIRTFNTNRAWGHSHEVKIQG